MKKGPSIIITDNISKIKRKDPDLENRHNIMKFSEIDFLKNNHEDSNPKQENSNNYSSQINEKRQYQNEEDKELENEINSNDFISKNQNSEIKKDVIFISEIEPKIGNSSIIKKATKGLLNLSSLKESESHFIAFADNYDSNVSKLFFSSKKKALFFPQL